MLSHVLSMKKYLTLSRFAKEWLPPILLRRLRKIHFSGGGFGGPFGTWAEAVRISSGYDSREILDKVLAATLKVKNGDVAYERDSVLFDEIQYAWPVAAGLMWAAAQDGGRLSVLDFGGSLGSSYFQNRQLLAGLKDVRWAVVEQQHFVEAGKKYIQDHQLHFYETIDECIWAENPNVVVLSSVLQYLEKPERILKELLSINAKIVIVDLTIINNGSNHGIYLQNVPRSIYSATYPVWSLARQCLLEIFQRSGYSLLSEFNTLDFPALKNIESLFKGYLFIEDKKCKK